MTPLSDSTSIIPLPTSVKLASGHFGITPETRINTSGQTLAIAKFLSVFLENRYGCNLSTDTDNLEPPAPSKHISLNLSDADPPEGYTLNVSPERVEITGADANGLFYGVQTLCQLLPEDMELPTSLTRCGIA